MKMCNKYDLGGDKYLSCGLLEVGSSYRNPDPGEMTSGDFSFKRHCTVTQATEASIVVGVRTAKQRSFTSSRLFNQPAARENHVMMHWMNAFQYFFYGSAEDSSIPY